jgi:tetratricopeptide (TPR) repeat protein
VPHLEIVGELEVADQGAAAALQAAIDGLAPHVRWRRRLPAAELAATLGGSLALLVPFPDTGAIAQAQIALALGAPVIIGDSALLAEVTQGCAWAIDPLDGIAWRAAIRDLAAADSRRRDACRAAARGFQPVTIDMVAARIEAQIEEFARSLAQPPRPLPGLALPLDQQPAEPALAGDVPDDRTAALAAVIGGTGGIRSASAQAAVAAALEGAAWSRLVPWLPSRLKLSVLGGEFAVLVRAGDRHRDKGEFAAAAACYGRAVELRPGDRAIWVQLGHMAKEAGAMSKAAAAYARALRIAADEPDIWLQLGHLHNKTGRRDLAAACYAEALVHDPENPDARRHADEMQRRRHGPANA